MGKRNLKSQRLKDGEESWMSIGSTGRSDATPETELDLSDADGIKFSQQHSHRLKRAQRRRRNPLLATDLDTSTQSDAPTELETSLQDIMRITASLHQAVKPLLIVSIGNPGAAYATTYHSIGHVVARILGQRQDPSALPSNWSIRQSKGFMNVSGPEVGKLAKREGRERSLVVLHDDMERAFGNVRVVAGANSAQGHNGIKSIKQSLPGRTWTRIAIGIGRPVSRESSAVSDYVLSNMKRDEMEVLRTAVADKVVRELEKLAADSGT